MKKVYVLLLALVLFSIGTIGTVAGNIQAQSTQVAITEEILYGDKSAAEGFTVTSKNNYDHHLFWETTYTIGQESATTTEFDFSAQAKELDYNPKDPGLAFSTAIEAGYDTTLPAEEQQGIQKAFKELYDNMKPDKLSANIVKLSELYDTYPLAISLKIPINDSESKDFYFDPSNIWQDENLQYISDQFLDFFTLPVKEEQWVQFAVSKKKDNEKYPHGSWIDQAMLYATDMISVSTGSKYFFTFDRNAGYSNEYLKEHDLTGEYMDVDTSLIPGGFGIYSFSYDVDTEKKDVVIHADSLTNFYPLESDVTVEGIYFDSELEQLLLFLDQGEDAYFVALDPATGEKLQEIHLGESNIASIREFDNFFFLYRFGRNGNWTVIAPKNGSYQHAFTIPYPDVFLENYDYFHTDSMAFDGEKLAMVGSWRDSDSDYRFHTSNYQVTIFDASGLIFHGKYNHGLAPDCSAHEYHNNCYNSDVKPLEISKSD